MNPDLASTLLSSRPCSVSVPYPGVGLGFKVLRGGTLSDKVAALTLQVQESPVHRMAVLDGLLDLGVKKERRTVSVCGAIFCFIMRCFLFFSSFETFYSRPGFFFLVVKHLPRTCLPVLPLCLLLAQHAHSNDRVRQIVSD